MLLVELKHDEELAERFMDWFNESGAKAFLHYQSENYPNSPDNITDFSYSWVGQTIQGNTDD